MAHSFISEQAAGPMAFYQADEHEHAAGGSTMLGFWIYLMSDCLMFAVLFATYGVLGWQLCRWPETSRCVRSVAGRDQHVDAVAVVDHVRFRDALGT